MKFTKITAAVLSITALATMPCIPEVAHVLPDYSISASAISMPDGYVTVNGISYVIQTDDDGTKMASVNGISTTASTLTIPATISWNGKTVQVKCINANAFYANGTVKTVDLTKATYLRRIYDEAFKCSTIETLKIGNSSSVALTIGNYAFSSSRVKNVTFYGRTVTIQNYAFASCDYLNSVSFESGVKTITLGEGAFSGLRSMRYIYFKNSSVALTLGKSCFANSVVQNITLPASVKTIPDYCFQRCCYLTSFQIPSTVTTIGKGAFQYASLPSTVKIGKNVKSIGENAFTYLDNTASFTVESGNTVVKAVSGALYSYNGVTLYCYPPMKTGTTFTCTARTIPDGAIANNAYLKNLYIESYQRRSGDTADFVNLTNLEVLKVPNTESSRPDFVAQFRSLLINTKLHKINGNELVNVPTSGEPTFYGKYNTYITDHFDELEYYPFMQDYVDKMATYVVKSCTDSSMTDLQKAVKLQKWIMNRVTYDHVDTKDPKNHVDASVFLHKRNGVRCTVCDGYARCYRILMEKAGIDCVYVRGEAKKTGDGGHAWNMIKIAGKWYHVDTCWDDTDYDASSSNKTYAKYYQHFLCSDTEFQATHGDYNWFLGDAPAGITSLPKATTNISRLGDANQDGRYQLNDVDKIQSLEGKTVGTSQQLINADMDLDGKITGDDTYLRYGAHYYNPNGLTPRLIVFTHLE